MDESKNRYLLMREVADLAIECCGGTVYGGYVRDFISHEEGAIKFFKSHTLDEYNDKTVSPETSDRFLVAKDIDIHFNKHSDYIHFRRQLRCKNFHTNVTKVENLYVTGTSSKHYELYTEFKVRVMSRILSGIQGNTRKIVKDVLGVGIPDIVVPGGSFKIDVVIDSTRTPPFAANLDYECNGLVMNTHGIALGEALCVGLGPVGKYRVFERVVEDIKRKRAVTVAPSRTRWEKMSKREDWEIVGGLVQKPIVSGEECIICHGAIPSGEVFKLECCNAHYHLGCISDTITRHIADREACPHCRQGVFITPEEMAVYSANIVNIF